MWRRSTDILRGRYYVVYVFEGAGLTGRRANLIADSVQYVLNVAFTGMGQLEFVSFRCVPLIFSLIFFHVTTYDLIVPAIIYIDRWGRRPMLLAGTMLMGFWLMLVGGLQGRFGRWGAVEGSSRAYCHPLA